MKNRELLILYAILRNDGMSTSNLLSHFHISKRTLYYDIKNINSEIRKFGQIQNIAQKFTFYGNYEMLQKFLNLNETVNFFNPVTRRHYVLRLLLEGQLSCLDKFYEQLGVSKNTRVNDLHGIQEHLENNGFHLESGHTVTGNEIKIRNLYLQLLQRFMKRKELSKCVEECVSDFSRDCDLQLTDEALVHFSFFLRFVRYRISQGLMIPPQKPFVKAAGFPYFSALPGLLGTDKTTELNYFASYLASLSSRKLNVQNDYVEGYLNELMDEFETKSALTLENREEFKSNIRHHMISLFYRTLFQFPVNTSVDASALNLSHEPLYKLVKTVLQNCGKKYPVFLDLNDEEVYYLTAYFGGYLANRKPDTRRKRVLLVCPHGLTVSKTLQFELSKYIPAIEIVDTIAVSQIEEYRNYYDAIICTVELPKQKNVITVNPILSRQDIQRVMRELYGISLYPYDFDMKSLLQVIEKNTTIVNKKKLKNDLMKLFYQKTSYEGTSTVMLKDLITEEKINIVDHVDNWEEAIKLAAQPLVEDHSIETDYVTAMINSVNEYGPYIVLDDYFALPHAKANIGVNRLGMALLVVKDEVDLVGNPVNVFLVLATIDTTSHLDALGTLSDILCERKNIDTFRAGNKQEILDLINRY